jgi:hypothetical protein
MLHEVVEINELKKMSMSINKQTVMVSYPEVYKAHITAMDYELTCALNQRNYHWLKRRLANVTVDDPYLPQEFSYLKRELAPLCKTVIKSSPNIYPNTEMTTLRNRKSTIKEKDSRYIYLITKKLM